jgi:hypothetical protein
LYLGFGRVVVIIIVLFSHGLFKNKSIQKINSSPKKEQGKDGDTFVNSRFVVRWRALAACADSEIMRERELMRVFEKQTGKAQRQHEPTSSASVDKRSTPFFGADDQPASISMIFIALSGFFFFFFFFFESSSAQINRRKKKEKLVF